VLCDGVQWKATTTLLLQRATQSYIHRRLRLSRWFKPAVSIILGFMWRVARIGELFQNEYHIYPDYAWISGTAFVVGTLLGF